MTQSCNHCGDAPENHLERAADTLATIAMMKRVADSLPSDYADTLNQVMTDWRTHTLPECDPSAIK